VIRRVITTLVVGGAIAGVACIDMSAPSGPASISTLLLPSPSVVVGDTMRDSAGVATPLVVQGFSSAGSMITVAPQFFVTDSIAHATVGLTTGFLVGDSLGQVHVVGQIGNLQTNIATIPVSVAPTQIAIGPTFADSLIAPFSSDTSLAGSGSTGLPVLITGVNNVGAVGFIAHYTVVSAPPSISSANPAVLLMSSGTPPVPSKADTTDGSGAASLSLTVVTARLVPDPAFLNGSKPDTAIVEANSTYRGTLLAGSPRRFVVQIRIGLIH
jgi:hypothetical protein